MKKYTACVVMLFLVCALLLIFLVGCAAIKENKIVAPEMIPANSVFSVGMEKVEMAFEILDEPLAYYYHLTNVFSEKLEYCSPDTATEMKILNECFQGIKFCFQRKWKEIYANPENAVSEAENFLPEILKTTKYIEHHLNILEMKIKQEKIWCLLLPYPTL